ncbi:MAG TPA: SURF1 family protein [Devosia sp.]|nr:SURF1 family protein [Devosia sp.]
MSESAAPRRLGLGFWSFIIFMLALTGLFVALGVWQLNRLAQKEALIAAVDERLHLAPLRLPPLAEWGALDPEIYSYRPVTVSGTFRNDQTVLVFASLTEPRGKFSGPGYWVMTPLVLDGGGVVFIDRGFVPQASGPEFAKGTTGPAGPQTITGVALLPEAAGAFTPGADRPNRIDWIRDPKRLAAMLDPTLAPVAGLFIEAPAGESGALPQGGETTIEFPNNHLGYAFTWFGFALLTPLLLAAWIWRQVRGKPKNIAASAPNH